MIQYGQTNFRIVEDEQTKSNCLIRGNKKGGEQVTTRLYLSPPPHPKKGIKENTRAHLFRFAKSIGYEYVEYIEVVGKYTTSTYVEDQQDPPQVQLCLHL